MARIAGRRLFAYVKKKSLIDDGLIDYQENSSQTTGCWFQLFFKQPVVSNFSVHLTIRVISPPRRPAEDSSAISFNESHWTALASLPGVGRQLGRALPWNCDITY
eukprot:GHVS01025113.1.p2 GENE.GHVS01025113.1~~GHVS01025113.1.p2  ORF type:complete len:105 (-),score=9.06 GHVS01025113.1:868-1182(-)